jgi:heme/copper-type cytochrome/quinol oxidase subunit 3
MSTVKCQIIKSELGVPRLTIRCFASVFYILINFHLTTVFIKNLCFSFWYHNMLQSGKNQDEHNTCEAIEQL